MLGLFDQVEFDFNSKFAGRSQGVVPVGLNGHLDAVDLSDIPAGDGNAITTGKFFHFLFDDVPVDEMLAANDHFCVTSLAMALLYHGIVTLSIGFDEKIRKITPP